MAVRQGEIVTVRPEDEVAKGNGNEQREDAQRIIDMKAYFDAQPKVTVKTRDDEFVQINGYSFIIKAGEKVEVPVDVADLLEQSGRI